MNVLIEIKDGAKSASRRALTPDEENFRLKWRGQYSVVNSPEEALESVRDLTRKIFGGKN